MDRSTRSSPASSPLSDPDSEQFDTNYYQYRPDNIGSSAPAAKRQRIDDGPLNASSGRNGADIDAMSVISSDTEGDVPQSPGMARTEDDEVHEQVTACAWDGCVAGDFGNMDKLVEHIHNDHIEGRQKKYTCEWADCGRKSNAHASGYALKAHMRSHTREKPFFCAVPECDRFFTRSDALAKHMRTVHETEALRPSDPIPKSMQPLVKSGTKLKLVIKQPSSQADGNSQSPRSGPPQSSGPQINSTSSPEVDYLTPLSLELGFTDDELALGSKELWRLLRRQVHWAEEEADSLRRECEMVEEIRKKEWLEKEILLHQVIKADLDWQERRKMVLASQPTLEELRAKRQIHQENVSGAESPAPQAERLEEAKREPKTDQREMAEVLASLHDG